MPFPPVPKELFEPSNADGERQLRSVVQNISAIFIYLQRLRDQSADEIATVIEGNPSLGGNTFLDSASVDFISTLNGVSAEVLNDSSIQKVESAFNDVLISTRKRLNFLHGVSIVDNASQNTTDITVRSSILQRVVNDSLTLHDTECIISSRYFKVYGTLKLEGDATLQVI